MINKKVFFACILLMYSCADDSNNVESENGTASDDNEVTGDTPNVLGSEVCNPSDTGLSCDDCSIEEPTLYAVLEDDSWSPGCEEYMLADGSECLMTSSGNSFVALKCEGLKQPQMSSSTPGAWFFNLDQASAENECRSSMIVGRVEAEGQWGFFPTNLFISENEPVILDVGGQCQYSFQRTPPN